MDNKKGFQRLLWNCCEVNTTFNHLFYSRRISSLYFLLFSVTADSCCPDWDALLTFLNLGLEKMQTRLRIKPATLDLGSQSGVFNLLGLNFSLCFKVQLNKYFLHFLLLYQQYYIKAIHKTGFSINYLWNLKGNLKAFTKPIM